MQHALAVFGPARLMSGSDQPACLLAVDYETSYLNTCEALGQLSQADEAAVYGANAMRFYRVS